MTRCNNRLNPKFEESLKAAKEYLKEIHVYRLEGGKKVSDRVMINRNWLPPHESLGASFMDQSRTAMKKTQCNPKFLSALNWHLLQFKEWRNIVKTR